MVSDVQGGIVLLILTQDQAAAFCNYKKENLCSFKESLCVQAYVIILVVYFIHFASVTGTEFSSVIWSVNEILFCFLWVTGRA